MAIEFVIMREEEYNFHFVLNEDLEDFKKKIKNCLDENKALGFEYKNDYVLIPITILNDSIIVISLITSKAKASNNNNNNNVVNLDTYSMGHENE
jgi:hypothetical protein